MCRRKRLPTTSTARTSGPSSALLFRLTGMARALKSVQLSSNLQSPVEKTLHGSGGPCKEARQWLRYDMSISTHSCPRTGEVGVWPGCPSRSGNRYTYRLHIALWRALKHHGTRCTSSTCSPCAFTGLVCLNSDKYSDEVWLDTDEKSTTCENADTP